MNKNEENRKIDEKATLGFNVFSKWLRKLNPKTSNMTSTPPDWHYDVDVFFDGCKPHKVEVKYMPQKVYDNYEYVTLNFEKPLQLPTTPKDKGVPGDMYYIQYADDVVVTMSRENIDNFIKDYGLCAFQVSNQYITEMNPSKGKKMQIQLAIPHKEAGKYFRLYKGQKRVK